MEQSDHSILFAISFTFLGSISQFVKTSKLPEMKICTSIQMLHSPVKLLSFFSKFESFSTLLYFGLAPTPVDGLENGTCEDPCVVEEGARGSRGIEIPDILKIQTVTVKFLNFRTPQECAVIAL